MEVNIPGTEYDGAAAEYDGEGAAIFGNSLKKNTIVVRSVFWQKQ